MPARSYNSIGRAVILWMLAFGGVLLWGGKLAAQDAVPPNEAALADPVDPDNLDKLLELADQDVTQLSKVNVAAPALQTEVSTVSRQTSTVGRSPAAVFVVSNEMIRRSGARSIAEVLRMVPGVQVARIDANKWAVSIRGFNGRFANKLLVQIDGRTVYTPLFGGVFWDVLDAVLVLEDIERIEVIRGPGATVWGANAVNGIINIITKKAEDTHGVFAQGGAGTEERGFATARYGGQLGEDLHYRFHGKWFERDRGYAPDDYAKDDWRMGHGGFRMDWTPGTCDTITFQGDYYDGKTGRRNLYPAFPDPDPIPPPPDFIQVVDDDAEVTGGNVSFRWSRELFEHSDWALQIYYDRTERAWPMNGFREDRDTFDLDFQHRFPLGWRNSFIWGFRYRNTKDKISDSTLLVGSQPTGSFDPTERDLDLFSYFVQDQLTLREDLCYLTVGSKFSHNDFTRFEIQPTARILWTPSERHSIWGAISRAVRTPTRAEDDIRLVLAPPTGVPVFPQALGNRAMESEDLMAYEAGVRVQPTDSFSWDLAVFYHDYDDVRSVRPVGVDPGPPPFAQFGFGNEYEAQSYGIELATNYQVNPRWKLYGAYTFLVVTGDTGSDAADPRNQIYMQSSWDLGRNWELDLIWRYVDRVPGAVVLGYLLPGVPSYNAMDVRLAWNPRPNLELAVVGRHLLNEEHAEFAVDSFLGNVRTEVQSEVYGTITWRY